jgi:hypothetical protein
LDKEVDRNKQAVVDEIEREIARVEQQRREHNSRAS